ncbi:molybdopterin-dependent oxidoreductase [Methylobacterium sp. E-065]|uniref:molybdopterin-dependent oxidoreductase n=1 Tax=Methylobacterium sp. E-065 TaxID=2836583 RepID=UPI001FBA3B54|nr:molybdopterin-dependent oxidoreductase [Methylobacterium sp. E-065]MCJ2016648.1 molybdopterin-dependent oxidoreductase [Methylobacterium sp. E-065]
MPKHSTLSTPSRRGLLSAAALGGMGLLASRAHAETVDLHVPGGPSTRPLTATYPEKGRMIVQRTRPPWLETPFEVFDTGVFTPNDRHFVSWHWATFPTHVDTDRFTLKVRGLVERPQALSLQELIRDLPRFEIAAVSQCAGNSRLYAQPRVAGAQWANGSMSNALYTGVRLRDVLDRAGVKGGATHVRFGGLDEPLLPDAPKFVKALDIDHARDGEVMLAFAMNGAQLPMLNGFPLKLIVPGWSAVYWIKMLDDIAVMDHPDTSVWTTRSYRVPDTLNHTVEPGQTDYSLIPITRNLPRSFVTNLKPSDTIPVGVPQPVRGIAFGGDRGVAAVDLSLDGGRTWQPTILDKDEGTYGFRQWQSTISLAARGAHTVMTRCTNTDRLVQPIRRVWNPGGYMSNPVEALDLVAA